MSSQNGIQKDAAGKLDCACSDDDILEFPEPDMTCLCGALTLEDCICKDADAEFEEMLKLCDCGNPHCTCNEVPKAETVKEFCLCCKLPTTKCKCSEDPTHDSDMDIPSDLPDVLESNHPLMGRFQEALRKYFTRELTLAEEEVADLKMELKTKSEEYENDLETIYQRDHDVNQQRKMIGEYELSLEQMQEERHERENTIKEMNHVNKQLQNELQEETKAEFGARRELKALEVLVNHLESWRRDNELDLTVKQRVSEKISVERKALTKEKRSLDIAIFKLNTEIFRLESELDRLKKQTVIKNEELEKVLDCNAELEGELEDAAGERKRLINVWNTVISNISRRDKIHTTLRAHYHELEEGLASLATTIEGMKKEEATLMKESQEASIYHDKLLYELQTVTRNLEAEERKSDELEKQIIETQELISMNEKDEELIRGENAALKKKLDELEREALRLNEIKGKLEETAMAKLELRFRGNHESKAILKALEAQRVKIRNREMSLMHVENNNAKLLLDQELVKAQLISLKEKHDEMQEMSKVAENQVTETKKKISQIRKEMLESQVHVDRKREELIEMTKNYRDVNKKTMISELECTRGIEARNCDELVSDWLRLQGHVVRLTAQHERLAEDIRLREQQISIMDQSKARIRQEKEKALQEAAENEKAMNELRSKLQWCLDERKRLKDKCDQTGKDISFVTFELSGKLRDEEASIIQTEEDIKMHGREKVRLTEEINAVRRAAVIWHRKCAQALELKKKMIADKSNVGEITLMKAEIHKMLVREGQLRTAAERLSKELAVAADRRSVMSERARANVAAKRQPAPHRIKLRLLKAACEQLEKEKEKLEKEATRTAEEYKMKIKQWEYHQAVAIDMEEDINKLQLSAEADVQNKQFTLEKLVRQQRFATELDKVVKRGVIKLRKPSEIVKADFERSKQSLNELKYTVEGLLEQSPPDLKVKLNHVMNSLTMEATSTTPNDSLSSISTTSTRN